jgi:hypothetical protein
MTARRTCSHTNCHICHPPPALPPLPGAKKPPKPPAPSPFAFNPKALTRSPWAHELTETETRTA